MYLAGSAYRKGQTTSWVSECVSPELVQAGAWKKVQRFLGLLFSASLPSSLSHKPHSVLHILAAFAVAEKGGRKDSLPSGTHQQSLKPWQGFFLLLIYRAAEALYHPTGEQFSLQMARGDCITCPTKSCCP